MEDDRGSTATMTSVTEDLSLDETDTSTQDIDTSSQITSSDIGDEGNTTVVNTPLPCAQGRQVAADVVEVSMEGGSEADEAMASTDEDKPDPYTSVTGEPNHSTQQTSSARQPWGSGVLMPDLLTLQGKWYEHECFNHYWRHYHYVSMWCQKHMETYRRMMEQYNRAMKRQTAAGHSVPSQPAQHTLKKPVSKKTIRNRKARRRRKAAKKRHRMEKKNVKMEQLEVGSSPSHSSDSEKVGESGAGETTESAVEGELMEAEEEITDELLDFFAHTHKHRQERGQWERLF